MRVATPDAIHLATAIIYQADELQTLDGFGKRGLIRFNGDIGVQNLKIVAPYPLRTPPAEMVTIDGPLYTKRFIEVSDGKQEQAAEPQKALPESTEIQGGSSGPTEGQTGTASEGKKEK